MEKNYSIILGRLVGENLKQDSLMLLISLRDLNEKANCSSDDLSLDFADCDPMSLDEGIVSLTAHNSHNTALADSQQNETSQ